MFPGYTCGDAAADSVSNVIHVLVYLTPHAATAISVGDLLTAVERDINFLAAEMLLDEIG